MNDCLFCKIEQDEIPSERIYEDDQLFAIKDINPQAPVHILIIPKKRIPTTNDLNKDDTKIIGEMVLIAKDIAKSLSIDKDGYRLVFNCNEHGGQTVYHIHLHLLGN